MQTLHVVNIKCNGCAHGITDALEKAGMTSVAVNVAAQTVAFEGDTRVAKKTLEKLGYPEAGTPAAASVMKKAKSYVTCAIGSVSEMTTPASGGNNASGTEQ